MTVCCDMRGFLGFLILRLLSRQHLSGDEIAEEILRRKGHKPSPGTIYPALKALAEAGFIRQCDAVGKEKRYMLTKQGERALEQATQQFVRTFHDLGDEFLKSKVVVRRHVVRERK